MTEKMTPEELLAEALTVHALGGRDSEDFDQAAPLVYAAGCLASAASGVLLSLEDEDHPSAANTTPEERDRYGSIAGLVLSIADVLLGIGEEHDHAVVNRAMKMALPQSQCVMDLVPDSAMAARYRRERGLA